MIALLIGATGATGKDLLELLLQDEAIIRVDIFVRRTTELRHPKLNIHIVDFNQPDTWKSSVKGDVLFSCLGTTLKAAGSKAEQWKVDYEYQYRFAAIARENKVHTCVLVSAAHASSRSLFFYSKMKGQLEDAMKSLHFRKLIVFNPPLLLRKDSDRRMEVWAAKAIRVLNRFGLFRTQAPIGTNQMASAMLNAVRTFKEGEHSVIGQDILKLS